MIHAVFVWMDQAPAWRFFAFLALLFVIASLVAREMDRRAERRVPRATVRREGR